MLYIACDPGASGGFAWTDSEATECAAMPPTLVDVIELLSHLSTKAKDVAMYLEEPPPFAGKLIPSSAAFKLGNNHGVVLGASIACGFKLHRVRPQTWMKAHPVGTKGDRTTTEWKNVLKGRAQELYPNVDGITLKTADALLILDAAVRGAIN